MNRACCTTSREALSLSQSLGTSTKYSTLAVLSTQEKRENAKTPTAPCPFDGSAAVKWGVSPASRRRRVVAATAVRDFPAGGGRSVPAKPRRGTGHSTDPGKQTIQ